MLDAGPVQVHDQVCGVDRLVTAAGDPVEFGDEQVGRCSHDAFGVEGRGPVPCQVPGLDVVEQVVELGRGHGSVLGEDVVGNGQGWCGCGGRHGGVGSFCVPVDGTGVVTGGMTSLGGVVQGFCIGDRARVELRVDGGVRGVDTHGVCPNADSGS